MDKYGRRWALILPPWLVVIVLVIVYVPITPVKPFIFLISFITITCATMFMENRCSFIQMWVNVFEPYRK